MTARRIAFALLAALFVSGGFTYLLSRKISHRGTAHGSTYRCVTVSREVQAGEVLKPEMLAVVDWPAAQPLAGSFTKIDDISGRTSIYPLSNAQPVLERYLAEPGSAFGLTGKIPDGMRATAVRSNEVAGVAGFLFPGSRVDVLVTYRNEQSATAATQIVLQDVEVLTAGQKVDPDPHGKPDAVSVVTLLLKPEEAERVVFASSQGSIQFVLRNGSDHEVRTTVPVGAAQLDGPQTPAVHNAITPRASHPGYSVETVAGDKHTISTFN